MPTSIIKWRPIALLPSGESEYVEIDEQTPLPVQDTAALNPGDGVSPAQALRVEAAYAYLHQATGAQPTLIVKRSPGLLHSIVFNTKPTASCVVTVYDDPSTSNTTVAAVDAANVTVGEEIIFDCVMQHGITVIVSGANCGDMTVMYR